MKRQVNIFISFAVKNRQLAPSFKEDFQEYIQPSKRFDYNVWMSPMIQTGKDWDKTIKNELERCDCAILLVSPSFLNSEYIRDIELPVLMKKPIVLPMMLYDVDLKRHDLHGLEKLQIFRLDDPSFAEPRSYYRLRPKRRKDFIKGLFDQLETRLTEELKD